MKKKVFIYCFMALVTFSNMSTISLASMNYSYQENSNLNVNNVRKADIRYQYKLIDGMLYKRLYNFTARTPVTEWEVVS